jgi:endonuclease/exonuclease/phosphatase family metal-dependent hydrolase
MPAVRLLTYNVRSLRDDAAAVARVMRAARPDLVCVQEAPRFWLWRVRCRVLARRCGLRWISGGRRAGANLLLRRPGVRTLARHDLAFSTDPGLHERGAAIAEVAVDGYPLLVVGTHLDLVARARLRHVAQLRTALDRSGTGQYPVVVAGDFNEPAPGPTWSALGAIGTDAGSVTGSPAATFPARAAVDRIDGIFVSAPAIIRSVEVIDSPDARSASDHLPVLATFDLPPRPSEGY